MVRIWSEYTYKNLYEFWQLTSSAKMCVKFYPHTYTHSPTDPHKSVRLCKMFKALNPYNMLRDICKSLYLLHGSIYIHGYI